MSGETHKQIREVSHKGKLRENLLGSCRTLIGQDMVQKQSPEVFCEKRCF